MERSTCHTDEPRAFGTNVHSMLGADACGACHGNAHELVTAEKLAPAKCEECPPTK